MVCTKCQRLAKPTALATPGVKKKNEMYYGSPAGSKTTAASKPTLGNTGVGKSKLLSAGAKNPYAAYSKTCTSKDCSVKIEPSYKYCNKCAYKANACAICGKSNSKSTAAAPVIAGQKFTMK